MGPIFWNELKGQRQNLNHTALHLELWGACLSPGILFKRQILVKVTGPKLWVFHMVWVIQELPRTALKDATLSSPRSGLQAALSILYPLCFYRPWERSCLNFCFVDDKTGTLSTWAAFLDSWCCEGQRENLDHSRCSAAEARSWGARVQYWFHHKVQL